MHELFGGERQRLRLSRIIFLVLCFAYCSVLRAAEVRGAVVDASGGAVVGATVKADCGIHVRTGADGAFVLSCSGEPRQIEVSAAGFRTEDVSVGGTKDVHVVLQPGKAVQSITVTGTLIGAPVSESAQSVTEVGGPELRASPQRTIDDALRNVAGFTLFRRTGSQVANPTAQGVSLRGLGASGASRALVLYDEVPLNDPFGGWVHWNFLQQESASRVEVLQGGGSDIYGNTALAGVVNIFPRRVVNALELTSEGGSLGTFDQSGVAGVRLGAFDVTGNLGLQTSDGYVLVPEPQRGPVDTPANARDLSGEVRIGNTSRLGDAFVVARGLGERRHNGTPLQTNRTDMFQLVSGLDRALAGGDLILRVDGTGESYHQSFSSIAANRTSETLARLQTVPSQDLGARITWLRLFGRHSVSLGGDARWVRGVTEETIFIAGVPSTLSKAGGKQIFAGGFVQDTWRIAPKISLTLGGRVDGWSNHDAFSRTAPVTTPTVVTNVQFPDRSATVFDPRLSLVFRPEQHLSLFATGYRSFRAPRLNELYRAFRLGNVLTLANANLEAERLTGVDAGVGAEWDRFRARATFFFDRVEDPVANVTLSVTPALITRQRQNAGRLESRGLELSSTWQIFRPLTLRADYEFADSRIVSFDPNPQLAGKRTPQVPRHSLSSRLLFNQGKWTGALQGRFSSDQFDDDLNLFNLGGASSFDLYAGRRWTSRFETYVAAENLLDSRDLVALTPTPSVGPPFVIRGGVKITLGREPQHP
jgi:outer membrane receptor protein involved in Fe transport